MLRFFNLVYDWLLGLALLTSIVVVGLVLLFVVLFLAINGIEWFFSATDTGQLIVSDYGHWLGLGMLVVLFIIFTFIFSFIFN